MTNDQAQRCSVCGADVKPQAITYTQTIAGQVYIVEDVPAPACAQCGETYLTPDTVGAIQERIERGTASETQQVPVFRVPQRR